MKMTYTLAPGVIGVNRQRGARGETETKNVNALLDIRYNLNVFPRKLY